jgi:hypothetical protein
MSAVFVNAFPFLAAQTGDGGIQATDPKKIFESIDLTLPIQNPN